jgi:CheY-like chemotaxis protein
MRNFLPICPFFPSTTPFKVGHAVRAVASSDPSALPDLRGVVALVVDDDPDAREIFAASLTHAGATVEIAGSARQALTILKVHVPDVVVTDMSMPGEDGLWLLNQIKKHSPEAARVPVVVVTGHQHLYGDRDMLSVGFQRYLTKPVDPWKLCGTVRELAADAGPGAPD